MSKGLGNVFAVAIGLGVGWALARVFGPLQGPWDWLLPVVVFGGLALYQIRRHLAGGSSRE